MSGILNSKTRIMDTILTSEGRRQLASGQLKAAFYSFTDATVIYSEDTIVSGGLDATDRIQLEASNLPQDRVTLEADDSGRLTGFPISGSERFVIRVGQIFSSSAENRTVPVTGSQFASLSEALLDSSIDNFKKLYILRSPDPLDEKEREFLVFPSLVSFEITETKPFSTGSISIANIDHIESFFQDKRLSHISNYRFLPPVNKARTGQQVREPLGTFININQNPILSYEDIKEEIDKLDKIGFSHIFRFTETSRQNNLLCQFFEASNNEMIKLDVIDFGSFLSVETGGTKHVFFVGKVFRDSMGTHTFVNMFTLVFES